MDIRIIGAAAFGALIGWYVYFINRHRPDQVHLGDLVTIIGILGGGAILALFPAGSDLFGGYGIGLGIGFFGYFLVLLILVGLSDNFNVDYFLDGRRKKPLDPWVPASGPGADAPAAMVDRPATGRDPGTGR